MFPVRLVAIGGALGATNQVAMDVNFSKMKTFENTVSFLWISSVSLIYTP